MMKLRIPILTRLWEVYQERQQYLKQVQHRLLRRKKIERDKDLETGHWTDRFLKSYKFSNVRCLTLLLLLVVLGQQSSGQVVPLQIGDKLSDLLAYQKLKPKTSNGFLMLFINSTCKGYQTILKETDSLAQLTQVPIIAITKEKSEQMAKGVLDQYQKPFGIQWLTNDNLWYQYFPHRIQPHVVWVNKLGVVAGISDGSSIQLDQLLALKNDKALSLPIKSDILDFNKQENLIADRYPSGNLYYNLIKPHIPGVEPTFGVKKDSAQQTVRTYLLNLSLFKMYMMAFGKAFFWTPNRLIWELKDRSTFVKDYSDLPESEWQKLYSYSYESVLPLHISSEERLLKIRDDLNLQFGLNCRVENRMVDVWVLKATGDIKPAVQLKPVNTLTSQQAIKELKNTTLKSFISYYNSQENHQPVIDETNYAGRIDLSLAVANLNDIPAVNAALKTHHLQLIPAQRELEFIVFSSKPKSL